MGQRLGAWVAGGLLILAGLFFLVVNLGYLGELGPNVWAALFALAGLGFWVVYGLDRRQWWAAIPGGTLLGVAGTILLSTGGQRGELAASLIFLGIAVGFLPAWLRSPRENWWALILMGVMLVMAVVVAIAAAGLPGGVIGFLMLAAIGLVFVGLYAYLPPAEGRRQWWPLIPAGVLFSFGLTALTGDLWPGGAAGAAFFAGLGATFGVLYLLRDPNTRWAIFPALGCLAFAAFILLVTETESILRWWPLLLILGGLMLLLGSLRRTSTR